MTDDDVRALLLQKAKEAGSQGALAKRIPCHRDVLNRAITGRDPLRHRVLKYLGLRRRYIYEPIE